MRAHLRDLVRARRPGVPTAEAVPLEPATVRLLAIARSLRQERSYTSLARTHTEPVLGALIREAVDDLVVQHGREQAAMRAALDEMREQLDAAEGARVHLVKHVARVESERDQARDQLDQLATAPSPEQLWVHVRTSEEGQRARHFQRLYGRASATIGQQRDRIGRLERDLMVLRVNLDTAQRFAQEAAAS